MKLADRIPKPASSGLPCNICIRIARIEEIILRGDRFSRRRELGPSTQARLRRLSELRARLSWDHPRCARCGLLMGDRHLACRNEVPGEGLLCQFCCAERRRKRLRKGVRQHE